MFADENGPSDPDGLDVHLLVPGLGEEGAVVAGGCVVPGAAVVTGGLFVLGVVFTQKSLTEDRLNRV